MAEIRGKFDNMNRDKVDDSLLELKRLKRSSLKPITTGKMQRKVQKSSAKINL